MKALDVIKQVCEEYDVPLDTILSRKRTKNVALARTTAMYRLKRDTLLSYHEIGDIFDKDHSSVYAAKIRVEKNIANNL